MKKKKWFKAIGIVVGTLLFCGVVIVSLGAILSLKGYGISTGRFYTNNFGIYLVDEGEAMLMSDKSKNQNVFENLSVGDFVLVMHSGVNETYPAQTGVYRIFRLQKGDASDLPEDLNVGQSYFPENEILDVEVLKDLDTFEVSSQRIRVRYKAFKDVNESKNFTIFMSYPIVEVFHSVDELNAYYEKNKEIYCLQQNEVPLLDRTLSFDDVCEKYDEAYFENQILVLMIWRETRGEQVEHNIAQAGLVGENQDKMVFDITTTENLGSLDIPTWFYFIEPEVGVTVEDKNDVTIFWDGENITDPPLLVQNEFADVSISLELPKGWDYGIGKLSNYSNEFYIAFWPKDMYEGKVKVGHYKKYNITLEPEDIHLGDSESGRFVVQKENTDIWWSEYGAEAMQILSTVRLKGLEE